MWPLPHVNALAGKINMKTLTSVQGKCWLGHRMLLISAVSGFNIVVGPCKDEW